MGPLHEQISFRSCGKLWRARRLRAPSKKRAVSTKSPILPIASQEQYSVGAARTCPRNDRRDAARPIVGWSGRRAPAPPASNAMPDTRKTAVAVVGIDIGNIVRLDERGASRCVR